MIFPCSFGLYNSCVNLLLSGKSMVPEIYPHKDGKIAKKGIPCSDFTRRISDQS